MESSGARSPETSMTLTTAAVSAEAGRIVLDDT
jgi:hypothetical protein